MIEYAFWQLVLLIKALAIVAAIAYTMFTFLGPAIEAVLDYLIPYNNDDDDDSGYGY